MKDNTLKLLSVPLTAPQWNVLEVALDSLDAKLKSIEQNQPSYYGRGQYKKTESEKDKQRILNIIDVCANKLDQIEGKRGAKEIFYNPQSP